MGLGLKGGTAMYNIVLKHYGDLGSFFRALRASQNYVVECVACGDMRPIDELPEHLTEEEKREICLCADEGSGLFLTSKDLAREKIEISHGLCWMCLRHSLTPIRRRRQERERNPDCFAKACHYCDQFRCEFRKECLVANEESEGRTRIERWWNRFMLAQEVMHGGAHAPASC